MKGRYAIKTIKVKLAVAEPISPISVCDTETANQIARAILATLEPDQEHFIMLALDAAHRVRGYKVISSGGVAASLVDPKILFRNALLMGASEIIIAHNHPSGNVEPSQEDLKATKKIKNAGELLDLRLLDHIIITETGYTSFANQGLLN